MPYFTSIFKAFPKLSVQEHALPIDMKGRRKQKFVSHQKVSQVGGNSALITTGKIIKDDEISTVVQNTDGLIIKFIKPRRWHEYYKVFYGASRTSKEVLSNIRLKELGFDVPNVIEYGIALVPAHFWGYTGYYVMEPAPGLGEAVHHLQALNTQSRTKFVDSLLQDLAHLKAHRIIYGDLALRNIFCGENGELCWIDTGIDEFSVLQQTRFDKKWRKSLEQFTRWESKDGRLTASEIQKVKALYE